MNVPSGYTALDLIGFTDKGNYDPLANYVKNDLTHHNNSIWRCLVDDTTGVTPAEGANWTVYIQNGTTLNGMADVNLTTPANGDLLRYNSTSSKWENQDVDSTPTQSSTKLVQSGGVYTQLANKANTADLATVATTGAYSDLSGTPSLAAVATSGAYSDLTGQPTIPTVNDATLTIQKNGTNVATFTANSSTDQTANITVPTATSDLTNDSNFVSDANYQHITVDSAMSSSSANPVQNQVIYGELSNVKQALANEVTTRSKVNTHNLLRTVDDNGTGYGVIYTKNRDKTFTISGQITTSPSIWACADITGEELELLKGAPLIISGSISNTSRMSIAAKDASGTYVLDENVYSDEKTITIPNSAVELLVYFVVFATVGTTVSGTYKPMLRWATDSNSEYSPWEPTNSQLLSYKDNGVLGAKNLLPISLSRVKSVNSQGTWNNNVYTCNGGTFTVIEEDGLVTEIVANGTFSTKSYLTLTTKDDNISMPQDGAYTFNGVRGGSSTTYSILVNCYPSSSSAESALSNVYDGDIVLNIKKEWIMRLYCVVEGTVNNVSYKPMIRLATDTDPTYQPYAMTNRELTDVASHYVSFKKSDYSGSTDYERFENFIDSLPTPSGDNKAYLASMYGGTDLVGIVQRINGSTTHASALVFTYDGNIKLLRKVNGTWSMLSVTTS